MATLLAHIRTRPGKEEAFEEVARAMFTATHRDETGVLHYQYWRGAEASTYYALLSFDDHQTFIAHQASEHHEAMSASFGELTEEIRLEWVDPISGASNLPATEHQAAPADADETIRHYTDTFSATVAPWWRDLRRFIAQSSTEQ